MVDAPPSSWRELAVARSLDAARGRAEHRVQRFVDAGFELLRSSSAGDFTVQDVVERAGQSLRSFYQHFSGKDDLLLALFEESVRSTAELLRREVAREDDPLERLHRFVVEYHRLCRPGPAGSSETTGPTPVIADFAQHLLTTHPAEAARAFAPLVSLFCELVDDAVAAGVVRAGLRSAPIAGIVLEVIMFNAFSSTIGGASPRADIHDSAQGLWDVMVHGIGAHP